MPIGLAPWSIRHHVHSKAHVEDAYKKLGEMGFNGLEGGIARGQGFTIDEEKELLAKNNLVLLDMYADAEKPDEAMKLAEAYGTKTICVGNMPVNMWMSSDGFKAYCEKLNKTAKPFADAGFKLSYHNHSQEFRNFADLNGKAGYEILIEETDPKGVVFCLDTFWAAAAGADPAYWLRRLKGRTEIVHFKDLAINERSDDLGVGSIPWRFAEVGQGNLNWQAIVEACREIGIVWYCIEQDLHRDGNAFESIKKSIGFMRNELGIK